MPKNNNDYVEVFIPKDRMNADNDTVCVGVNDKTYRIRRGEVVKVPKCVKEVLDHAEEGLDYADKFLNTLHK